MSADSILLSSCQAANMDGFCRDLAGYLSNRLSVPAQFKGDVPWQERERLLDEGELDLCWICGLPYVRKVDQPDAKIVAFAAPVMQAARYQNRPVYFSDVVVHRDSPFQKLADLGGASWAYNEPGSHSGYGVVRCALAQRGESLAFFGRVIEAGAHQTSLKMILNREVDASAIDSTVLETELENDPSIAAHIRVIDTFGPSPIPPWVVSTRMPAEIRENLARVLTGMQADPEGQVLLQQARMARFVSVSDHDYDPIREMAKIAFK